MPRIDAAAVVLQAVNGLVRTVYTATAFKPATLELGVPWRLFDGVVATMTHPVMVQRTPDGRRAIELLVDGGLTLTITEEL